MANSVDVVSGEKLPNGDVSQFMTAMNKELSSIKEKGTTEGLTIQDKAHFLAVAKNLTGAIEYYTNCGVQKLQIRIQVLNSKTLELLCLQRLVEILQKSVQTSLMNFHLKKSRKLQKLQRRLSRITARLTSLRSIRRLQDRELTL